MLNFEFPLRAANGDSMLDRLAFCIAASTVCAQTCVSCTDAALAGPDFAALRSCTKAAQDCADISALTAKLLLRATGLDHEVMRRQVQACAAACRACRLECEQHVTVLEFCSVCATACRVCEQSCAELAPALAA